MDNELDLPVVSRLGYAADAVDFIRIAASIGLDLSERTAHRILAGTIAPLRSVASRLLREKERVSHPKGKIDLERDRRGLKIGKDDLASFSRALERDFNDLASRYYMTLSQDPKIRVSHDRITVTFEIDKEDA